MGLTEKQVAFCEAYTFGEAAGNATEAALRAGYDCSNRESAGALGAQLLKNPEVWGSTSLVTPPTASS